MKKLLLLMAVAIMGIGTMNAQKNAIAAGVSLGFATDIKTLDLGAKVQYSFTDAIRGEIAFNYFFEKNNVSFWDLEATAHYLFNVAEKFKLYPLAGFAYAHASAFGHGDGDCGFNIGAGGEYALTEKLSLGLEIKYQFSGLDQALINLGVAYKF